MVGIPTDRKELLEKYTDIPTPTDARNEAELSGALFNAVKKMAIKENDASPEHNFFIGLAYLGGVDVEINYTRAIDLITSAAEAGFVDAMEKLIDIYQNGIGVSSDYTKVVFWQRKLNDSLKSQLDIKKTTDAEIKRYSDLVFLLSNNLKRMGFGDESVAVRKEYCEFYEAFVSMRYKDDSRKLPEAYQELFYDYSKIGLKDKARICIEKAFSHFTGDAWECDVKNVWLFTEVSRNLLKINEEAERGKILETIDKIVELFIQRSEVLPEADRFAVLIDLYESYANILKSENKCAAAEKYYIDSYSLIAEKVDFDKVVDTRIINKLLGVLHSLNLLKRYEGKEEESKKYALKTVDMCLKYIDWIERFEYDKSRKILMISDQYNGISNQYKNSGIYFDALCYGEKRCKYLENAAENGLTVKFAKLLESAYYDLIAIYKAKECTQELSGEEKENKAAVIKKRIETLGFIFERYNEEPDSLYALRRACDTLHALISSHMSIGDKKEATDYTEKKLKLSLDIYAKTRFLSDAYSAYYDASYFYERLEQYDKAVEYLVRGIEYEEKEIQGLSSRDEQERLAYLYRKAGNAYIKAGSSEKGVVLFKKSFQIKADIHNKYNDLDSAKALYRSISEMALYTHSFDDSIVLAEKLQALKAEWPQL